jgi:hypothetical protein
MIQTPAFASGILTEVGGIAKSGDIVEGVTRIEKLHEVSPASRAAAVTDASHHSPVIRSDAQRLPSRSSCRGDLRFRQGFWSGTRDSNSRHPAWEAGTLPTELVPQRDRFVTFAHAGVNGRKRNGPGPPREAWSPGRPASIARAIDMRGAEGVAVDSRGVGSLLPGATQSEPTRVRHGGDRALLACSALRYVCSPG